MKWHVVLVGVVLSTQSVFASDDNYECYVGADAQKTQLEVKQHFEQQGWQIRAIEKEHGCFQIYMKHIDGRRGEFYVDPVTLELLQDDDDDDDDDY